MSPDVALEEFIDAHHPFRDGAVASGPGHADLLRRVRAALDGNDPSKDGDDDRSGRDTADDRADRARRASLWFPSDDERLSS